MKSVVYKGPYAARELAAADLKKAGVEAGEFSKTRFDRNQPVEVEDSVAKALLDDPKTYGNFETMTKAEVKALQQEGQDEGAPETGSASTPSSTTSSTPSATPTGSSTRTK